jgi:hypothetical protein
MPTTVSAITAPAYQKLPLPAPKLPHNLPPKSFWSSLFVLPRNCSKTCVWPVERLHFFDLTRFCVALLGCTVTFLESSCRLREVFTVSAVDIIPPVLEHAKR